MVTATGCVPLNEAMNSRDLECTGVPDDMCVRLADDLVSQWLPSMAGQAGPIVKVTVKPVDCGELTESREAVVRGLTIAPGARCWEGTGEAAVKADGSGMGLEFGYYQNADGRIFDDRGWAVESGPVE